MPIAFAASRSLKLVTLALLVAFLCPRVSAQSASAEASGSSTTEASGSGSGGGGGPEMTYGPDDTDLGGGTVTLARAIFNGGTVSNGTISADLHEAHEGTVTAILTGNELQKYGSGTFTVASASTYTGYTYIAEGTLKLGAAGSIANSSAVGVSSGAVFDVSDSSGYTVGPGQFLSGAGRIIGNVTVNGTGYISPGDGNGSFAGTLTFQNLTLQSNAILEFDLGSTPDTIAIEGGMLTGPDSGPVIVHLYADSDFTAGTYTLMDFSGGTTAGDLDLSDFAFNRVDDFDGYNLSYNLDASGLYLTATSTAPVPEPATLALIAGSTGLVAVIVRRRRLVTKPRDS